MIDRPRLSADDLRNFALWVGIALVVIVVLFGMTAVPEPR
jgi:hypothetical protein